MCTGEFYPVQLPLIKANASNEHCPFLDLEMDIFNNKSNTKFDDERYEFTFPNVNFSFLNVDIPCSINKTLYVIV